MSRCKHWAEPWKKEQLSIKWHVPNKEEINMVKCIVEKFMQPIVKIVTKLQENMKGVILSDQGEYVCQAKNPAGSIEAEAKLSVHSPPSFNNKPKDQMVEEGATVVFACDAQGNPPPAKFWAKEGNQELMFPGHISNDGRMKVSNDGSLQLANVRLVDVGYYVCSALNAAGSNIAKAYLKVAGRVLLEQPPPIITAGPANQTLPLKSLAILPCKAVGHKIPNITWTKGGKEISDTQRFTQLSTGALQIVTLESGDSGVYVCQAKNEDGTTTWSAALKVEAHTNPSVIFHRMPESATFPSAPSKPRVFNTSENTISLQWTPPNKHGASSINAYLLQYYSPQLGQAWFNVPDYIRDPEFVMRDLKHGANYIFIVRSENSHGIGEPSPMSSIISTRGKVGNTKASDMDLELARKRLGAEQLVKLQEVKTINSTAVKLYWRVIREEPLIQGYYMKWQGPATQKDAERKTWLNVTNRNINSQTVTFLTPFTQYTFFVVPYFKTVEGIPSNSMEGRTKEAVVIAREIGDALGKACKKSARETCALQMVKQLYKLGVIPAFSGVTQSSLNPAIGDNLNEGPLDFANDTDSNASWEWEKGTAPTRSNSRFSHEGQRALESASNQLKSAHQKCVDESSQMKSKDEINQANLGRVDIHGGWTVENCRAILHAFVHDNKQTPQYKYNKICEMRLTVPSHNKTVVFAQGSGTGRKSASTSCRLSMVRQLYYLKAIDAYSNDSIETNKEIVQAPKQNVSATHFVHVPTDSNSTNEFRPPKRHFPNGATGSNKGQSDRGIDLEGRGDYGISHGRGMGQNRGRGLWHGGYPNSTAIPQMQPNPAISPWQTNPRVTGSNEGQIGRVGWGIDRGRGDFGSGMGNWHGGYPNSSSMAQMPSNSVISPWQTNPPVNYDPNFY